MLRDSTYTLCSYQSTAKALQVEPAFENTFVLLTQRDLSHPEIHHLDRQGNTIHSFSEEGISFFNMINDREVVVPLPSKNEIAVLDLKKEQNKFVRKLAFNFDEDFEEMKYEANFPSSEERKYKGFFFEESKLMCLVTEKIGKGHIKV